MAYFAKKPFEFIDPQQSSNLGVGSSNLSERAIIEVAAGDPQACGDGAEGDVKGSVAQSSDGVYIKSMNAIIISSRDLPPELVREMKEGSIIYIPEMGYTLAPSKGVVVVDSVDDEAADMVSLRSKRTGVDNTVFVSTRGYAQHSARIKIAVDPPDALNATSKSASMAISDFKMTGEYLDPHIVEQAKQFIERNREALISYWNCEIDTDELINRLK